MGQGSGPRACVIVPCFNYGKFVRQAVQSALGQRGADVRVIIVDDGSSDGVSPAACDACAALSPRVRVVHQTNAGAPAARNAGAAIARDEAWAEYLVFLDADDWLEPEFVATLHAAILESETAMGAAAQPVSHAYCQERLVELEEGIWRVPAWDPVLLMVTNLHPITTLIRRSAFEAVGGFDPAMSVGYEDWDLWLRVASAGYRGVRVQEPLFVWRRHSPSTLVLEHARRHDELYTLLTQRHAAMYQRHALEIIRTANRIMKRAEAHWVDDQLDAIIVRGTHEKMLRFLRERDEARAAGPVMAAEAAQRVTDQYEAKPSIRFSRWAFGVLDSIPAPITQPVRWLAQMAQRSKAGKETGPEVPGPDGGSRSSPGAGQPRLES